MDAPMEFWGVEVKVGQTVTVDPMDPVDSYIHISQVALGEAKKEKPNESVVLYLKVGEQKIVLGTLSRDGIPHLSLDLVLDSDSELSHTSKSASVFFCGYRVLTGTSGGNNASDFSDSEEDEELALEGQDNDEGAKVTKPSKPVPKIGAPAKTADPKKDEGDDSDDESDDDLAGEDEFGSSDEMDDDSDSDEESDEETPAKKVDQGKKRPNESAAKTPVSAKKAKTATPEKTNGKKNVHVATPHPSKKGGKTPNSTKGQSPSSAGQLSCASCKKSFTNEVGLQQHKKAKHGGQ
ncbi:hypothetical protein AAZX31_11G163800 [Glycine max]